jgi:hypothetical protein
MKYVLTLCAGLAVVMSTTAQVANTKSKLIKNIVIGKVKDATNNPIKGVRAFVYRSDSMLVASGFTDADGRFETNVIPAGAYYVKFVYPTNRNTIVTGVTMKAGNLELNLKGNPPEADTFVNYATIMPKVEPVKK